MRTGNEERNSDDENGSGADGGEGDRERERESGPQICGLWCSLWLVCSPQICGLWLGKSVSWCKYVYTYCSMFCSDDGSSR